MTIARCLRALLLAILCAAACGAHAAGNRSDLWWNPAEAGQGLVVIDHETDLFVVWCTYDWSMPMWFVAPGGTLSADRRTFQGTLYETSSAGDGDVEARTVMPLAQVTIDFAPDGRPQGWLRYTVRWDGYGGIVELHDLTRQAFGSAAPSWKTDATDMWRDPRRPDGAWPRSSMATPTSSRSC